MDTPTIEDIQENLNELGRLTDQSEVEKITLLLWRVVALQLATKHPDEASELISDACKEIESQWQAVKETGSEARFLDALSDFKAEASQN